MANPNPHLTQPSQRGNRTANRGEHFVLVNRAPKSRAGWIHIVPKGELPHKSSGITQVVDDEAIDSIWNRLQELRANPNWEGLYAGREHFIYDDDKDSEALGWFKNFDRDDDGIWAKDDDLTDIGKDAIQNKRYKFTSMVINHSDMQKLGEGRFRPMAIDTVGFTNIPNARQLLAPISNRSPGTNADDTFPGRLPGDTKNNQRKKMKTVLEELDLSPEASEESAHAAVIKLKNRIKELEPLTEENTKLKNRVSDLDTQNVDSLLASRGIKDEKIKNRLKPVLANMETVADRVGFLDDCGYKATETTKDNAAQVKLFNRDGKAPGASETGGEAKDEKASADKIMNRARVIMKETPNLKLATAVTMAKRELASS